MLRVLPVLIAIVLAVYCLVDVVMRTGDDVRYLPRWAWGVIIVIVPIVGPAGYLIVGREQRQPKGGPASGAVGPGGPAGTGPLAPDDDPEFLNQIRRKRQQEQEEKLKRWQEELEERERELQQQNDDDEGNGKGPASAT